MGINCGFEKNKKLKQCKERPKPLIPYFEGKQRVADKIISKFPDHKTFVEPFAGGGAVYWKNTIADKFVVNDKNKDVCTLYKTAKNNPGNLKKCDLNNMNKEKFDRLKNKSNKSACEVIKLHKHGFSGSPRNYLEKNRTFKNHMTEEQSKKLKKTTVLCQDYKKVMEKYDSKNTLHYLDPPYVKAGKEYISHGVTPKEVCDVAKKMKGKVVISYDDCSEVKKSCKGLKFRKIKFPYSSSFGKNKEATELLITNY